MKTAPLKHTATETPCTRFKRNIEEDTLMLKREIYTMGTAAIVSISIGIQDLDAANNSTANVSKHLTVAGRVNLGSFYTPAKYVETIGMWLKNYEINDGWVIADISCGYGAFFELAEDRELSNCKFIGNDIDGKAVAKAREMFPFVRFFELNALENVSRERFGMKDSEKIVIVGNPPYNDITSQINQDIKTNNLLIDEDIKTRDLGMSSLLAYNKLKADYVAVLHPLSYLIKKANFKALRNFFGNYSLVEHVIFSSQEFAGTSKIAGFPIVVALYKRTPNKGLTYEDILEHQFKTVEGDTFTLGGFDYVTDLVKKYPHKIRYEKEILFYTMRDINALNRSRTFLKDRIANAIDVNPKELAYYCYIDCFKRYAKVPYWMGNFNVPFDKKNFGEIAKDVIADACYHHQDVFGKSQPPQETAIKRIKTYINEVIRANRGGKKNHEYR